MCCLLGHPPEQMHPFSGATACTFFLVHYPSSGATAFILFLAPLHAPFFWCTALLLVHCPSSGALHSPFFWRHCMHLFSCALPFSWRHCIHPFSGATACTLFLVHCPSSDTLPFFWCTTFTLFLAPLHSPFFWRHCMHCSPLPVCFLLRYTCRAQCITRGRGECGEGGGSGQSWAAMLGHHCARSQPASVGKPPCEPCRCVHKCVCARAHICVHKCVFVCEGGL